MHKNKAVLELLTPFVQSTFENGIQLDLLDLLHEQSDCAWTAARAAAFLNEKEEAILQAARHLEARGLLKQLNHNEFCYQPRTALSNALVNLLVVQLKSRRLQIVRLIYGDK